MSLNRTRNRKEIHVNVTPNETTVKQNLIPWLSRWKSYGRGLQLNTTNEINMLLGIFFKKGKEKHS